jgi:hypothetical protein
MKIGPLTIEWEPLTESERTELGLDPWASGYEALCISWRDRGVMVLCRPRR